MSGDDPDDSDGAFDAADSSEDASSKATSARCLSNASDARPTATLRFDSTATRRGRAIYAKHIGSTGTRRVDDARRRDTRTNGRTGRESGRVETTTRRDATLLALAATDAPMLVADNCHAQNGYSPLAAWHGGLETARESTPLAPDVDGEDTRATPVRSRRRTRRATPPSSLVSPTPPLAQTRLFEIFAHTHARADGR